MLLQNEILENLNEEQKIAVQNYRGPQFLVAGPGSGKTRCLVSRTQYMLTDGINPENILLFTFTNKAANEIKQRIGDAVGINVANRITMGTYHSFCYRLLRQYYDRLGYKKNFSIYDSNDTKKITNELVKGTNLDGKALTSYISAQKRKIITPQQAMESALAEQDPYANYYAEYQNRLKNQNSMDFDDLIFNTIMLLRNNCDVLEKVNSRYLYISADEFHDSSRSDIELIRLLAGDKQNICFILDDNQSIYGFRGADILAVLNVKNMFSNLKTYFLNQNYRSTSTIVNASKSLIAHNSNQIEKNIYTNNNQGEKIIVLSEKNPQIEAIRVVKVIQTLIRKYNYQYKDIAILYRTSGQSRVVEETFLKYKIPYEIMSGINFYDRKEIKDIISFVKLLTNPYDVEAFSRIINIPRRGIGNKTIEKIINEVNSYIPPIDIITACNNLIEKDKLKGKAKKGIENFLAQYTYLLEKANELTVSELIAEIIKTIDYYEYLKNEDEEKYDDKVSNIQELINLSYSFVSLDDFIEQLSLEKKIEDEEDTNRVHLLTMHMSKGLEWPAVFIIGATEGITPHFKSLGSQQQIEEERRLFYVAMTRAKKNLFITYPQKIQQNGYFIAAKPSRFIKEIDRQYLFQSNNK